MLRHALRLIALVAATLVHAAPTLAAITRVAGPTTLLRDGREFVKFDAAYDSVNRVYLAAYGTQHTGPVNGILLNENGAALTGLFALSDGAQQSGWARVIFSPEQGKFLVSYVKIMGGSVHQKIARFVTVSNNTASLGPEMILDAWGGHPGTATGMAYAAAAGKFLVTWWRYLGPFPVSFVSVVDPTGTFSLPKIVSDPSDGESDPEIACDPVARRCLVVGIAWGTLDGSGKASFWARFIQDATGEPLGGVSYVLRVASLMDPPAVVFHPATAQTPAQFLLGLGMGGIIKGLVADGPSMSFGSPFNMMHDTTGTQGSGYGFVSLRFNPGSQTTIASMTTWTGLAAVQELNGAGQRVPNGFDILPDTPEVPSKPWDSANQFAIVATNRNNGGFLSFENHYFRTLRVAVYKGSAASAGPVVTQQPVAATARKGDQVTFTAAATGSPAPTVQWYVSGDGGGTWSAISGATAATYSFTVKNADNQKLYRAYFFNGVGQAFSKAVLLTVASGSFGDFDGDGVPDPLVWRPSNGTFYWAESSNATANLVSGGIQWGNPALGDVVLNGANMDGDNLDDLVVWRASTGTWHWLTSSTGYSQLGSHQGVKQWGNASLGDVPLLADMDGDGKSDLVVWRASTGMWYWLTSSSGYNYNAAGLKQWGNQGLGDKPLTGDFDGDGSADPAVWRASTGEWFWLKSSSGYAYAAMGYKQWGNAALGDQTLVGDMDGDRQSDLVIWRPGTGTWYWLTSSSGYNYASARGVQWGSQAHGDQPLLTDFDGDGLSDLVVFRPSGGGAQWYWLYSSTGYSYNAAGYKLFGSASDIPLLK